MEEIPRNVILDLLPVYLAGEASEETKVLVEAYAQKDPQIARLIRTGTLETAAVARKISPPDDLEMKTLRRIRRRIRRQMAMVAAATAALLLIPLVAMQFTEEVNWGLFDFIIMGMLLFGAGLAYVLISKVADQPAYRAAVGIAVLTGFLLIWVNLAVGIIGSEDHPANLLYGGVLVLGMVGAGMARLRPRGMARTLFITAVAQLLVPVIAMLIWPPPLENLSGIAGIFILNGFFAGWFAVSGWLFRRAAQWEPPGVSGGEKKASA